MLSNTQVYNNLPPPPPPPPPNRYGVVPNLPPPPPPPPPPSQLRAPPVGSFDFEPFDPFYNPNNKSKKYKDKDGKEEGQLLVNSTISKDRNEGSVDSIDFESLWKKSAQFVLKRFGPLREGEDSRNYRGTLPLLPLPTAIVPSYRPAFHFNRTDPRVKQILRDERRIQMAEKKGKANGVRKSSRKRGKDELMPDIVVDNAPGPKRRRVKKSPGNMIYEHIEDLMNDQEDGSHTEEEEDEYEREEWEEVERNGAGPVSLFESSTTQTKPT
jgi:hypothetical protein